MPEYDIGIAAINRASYWPALDTLIQLDNPADWNGVVSTIEVWPYSNIAGLWVGTFYGAEPRFTRRAHVALGEALAGAKRTFSGLSLAVQVGDYIGCYFTSGGLEEDASGGTAVYYQWHHECGDGEETYSEVSHDVLSLYGSGAPPAGFAHSFGVIF